MARGPDLYTCCEHCEHSRDMLPDQHLWRCPRGCNDPEPREGGSDDA